MDYRGEVYDRGGGEKGGYGPEVETLHVYLKEERVSWKLRRISSLSEERTRQHYVLGACRW